MMSKRSALLKGAAAGCAAALAAAAPAGEDTAQYGLTDFSFYFSGCFPPCDCPLLAVEATGTFRLALVTFTSTYRRYAIEDVRWQLGGEEGTLATGTGVYERFLDFGPYHRLQLDVAIGNGEVLHYDSNAVPGGDQFPVIEASASRFGMTCYDEGFTIRGVPQARPCPGDVDGSGVVGFGDLLAVLSAWGPCDACPEDVDDSGAVDFADLLIVLASWGGCP
jgi:hypothetical protein